MRRGTTDAVPAFPEIKDQLGYNPARFLVPTDDAMDELSWTTRAKAFIRGMDDVETVRAWLTVEAALEQGANGGPRKKVIRWLNQRQAAIEGRDVPADDTAHTDAAAPDETTEPVAESGTPTPSRTTASTETALAADGGATPETTPSCPTCHEDLTREEIGDDVGFWCPACGDFKEPRDTAEAPTEETA
jgi:predicted RNA-binding Zn-ribbon protein involved in translation (DUF1610 family)